MMVFDHGGLSTITEARSRSLYRVERERNGLMPRTASNGTEDRPPVLRSGTLRTPSPSIIVTDTRSIILTILKCSTYHPELSPIRGGALAFRRDVPRDARNNVAKRPFLFETALPRTRLQPEVGQGFGRTSGRVRNRIATPGRIGGCDDGSHRDPKPDGRKGASV